jgi:cytochrome c556
MEERMKLSMTIAVAIACAVGALGGIAQADDAAERAIKARKAHMQLNAWNLGTLGAMAKGDVDYDAEAAQAAADNLAALASMSQQGFWPPGSDSVAMAGETRAKSEIWTTFPAISESGAAMNAAAKALAAVAGDGLPALQGALGEVGKSCGGCHKTFREEN